MNVLELIAELQKIEDPANKQVEVTCYYGDWGREWTSTINVEEVEISIDGVRQPVVRLIEVDA